MLLVRVPRGKIHRKVEIFFVQDFTRFLSPFQLFEPAN
jgi:hypothetical protein